MTENNQTNQLKAEKKHKRKNAFAEIYGVENKNTNELKEIVDSISEEPTEVSISPTPEEQVDNKIEENNKEVKQLKKLAIGETLIGSKFGRYQGSLRELKIYYGGYVLPIIDNHFPTLKKEHYDQILEEFLNSEEGKQYERPTEQEKKEAQEKVRLVELNYEKQLQEQSQNENAQIQPAKSALALK